MVYEANTLKTTLETNWALVGTLSKTFNAVTNPFPVQFSAHRQEIKSLEQKKVIEVSKRDALENTNRHELFEEVSNGYDIIIKINAQGYDKASYDQAEADAEDMEEEVVRILKANFADPSVQLGTFFHSDYDWAQDDRYQDVGVMLQRTLSFTLTKIRSHKTTVYIGYGGVLAFKIAGSQGSGLPGVDYTYTEAYDVFPDEGYEDIEENIQAHPDGKGVAVHFRGSFKGALQCKMYAKKADFGAGSHQLNNIYRLLTAGASKNQPPEVFFLNTSKDTEGTPATLTQTIKLRVTNVRPLYVKDQLVVVQLTSTILKPSDFVVA